MTITVDYLTKIISVPQADLTFISGTLYELDTDAFRLELADIQDSEEGIPFDDMYVHNTETEVAGTTFARTIEIINGYSIEFEDAQYSIRLVGSNNNIFDVENGILVQNQVQIISNNSAGLINAPIIDLIGQQVLNKIYVDTNGESGTEAGIGTYKRPVNNLIDAYTIAIREGITAYSIKGSFTLDRDYSNWNFEASGSKTDAILGFGGENIDDSFFQGIQVSGAMSGRAEFLACDLGVITGFDGICKSCGLENSIQTVNDADLTFADCFSKVAGNGTPAIDAGTNITLSMRNYSGGIRLENFTSGCVGTIDLSPGHANLDSSCVGGAVVVRGIGQLTDNSAGLTVFTEGLVEGEDVSSVRKVLLNRMETDPVTGIMTIYDDDDTVLLTAQLFEDVPGLQTYRGRGAERRNKLT